MYEQLAIAGFFADSPESAEASAQQTDSPFAPEDRPLDKVKRPTEKDRSREYER